MGHPRNANIAAYAPCGTPSKPPAPKKVRQINSHKRLKTKKVAFTGNSMLPSRHRRHPKSQIVGKLRPVHPAVPFSETAPGPVGSIPATPGRLIGILFPLSSIQ
jgi:hypothetical protein